MGAANAATISNMARNGLLHRSTMRKEMGDDGVRGLFHGFPEELKITAVMCTMYMAPATRKYNNTAL